MNELQKYIYRVIVSIINTPGIDQFFEEDNEWRNQQIVNHAAIRYGILNYVAKFSLANNSYLITEDCYRNLINLGLIKGKKLRRATKGQKNKFTFEHPIPSNVISDLIIDNKDDESKIKNILLKTNLVTAITYEEDSKLRRSGFVSKMPLNWNYNSGDMFARYREANIEIPSKRLEVWGAIAR